MSLLAGAMLRAAIVSLLVCSSLCRTETTECDVKAKTDKGWICGQRRLDDRGGVFASFRGVPYAKQPLGELRFAELQPAEPWGGFLNASSEGPTCPQTEVFYGHLMSPQGMGEACIHANVHVPIRALPVGFRSARRIEPPTQLSGEEIVRQSGLLPVLVFVHGGGFAFGSGDTDLHGPEYLVSNDVVVITFNYRLGVFGFLSLDTALVPGNNGIRDVVTLLHWVQRNARAFGGDPEDVTLSGQSAGAAIIHLLTLSKVSEGLFKRAILMSGLGFRSFFTTSSTYSALMRNNFLDLLGLSNSSLNFDEVHKQLTEMPLDQLVDAHRKLISITGTVVFAPVVESSFPGVTPMVEANPETLIAEGRGKDVPLLVGFTNSECETFKLRFETIDMVSKIQSNPSILLTPATFSMSSDAIPERVEAVKGKYFQDDFTMSKYVNWCTDFYFQYPAMKLADVRFRSGGAPLFLYQFSFASEPRIVGVQGNRTREYKGSGHAEDLTFIFKTNSVLDNRRLSEKNAPYSQRDMQRWMTDFIVGFMKCSDPTCNPDRTVWQSVTCEGTQYEDIDLPTAFSFKVPTKRQEDMFRFIDSLYDV